MQTIRECPWARRAPYTAMLQCYARAVQRLSRRREELKEELRALKLHPAGTLESARRQKLLEKRIDLLYEEYLDLTDAMREIRIYAAKEQH